MPRHRFQRRTVQLRGRLPERTISQNGNGQKGEEVMGVKYLDGL